MLLLPQNFTICRTHNFFQLLKIWNQTSGPGYRMEASKQCATRFTVGLLLSPFRLPELCRGFKILSQNSYRYPKTLWFSIFNETNCYHQFSVPSFIKLRWVLNLKKKTFLPCGNSTSLSVVLYLTKLPVDRIECRQLSALSAWVTLHLLVRVCPRDVRVYSQKSPQGLVTEINIRKNRLRYWKNWRTPKKD